MAAAATISLLFAPTGSLQAASAAQSSGSVAAPPHIMLVMMENHGYDQIVGNPTAPYLNQLIARYGLATSSYAWTHPSLPNYLDMVSGSTQGIHTDCTTCTANGTQLADQLQTAGIGWRAYMESMPSVCYTGTAFPYAKRHDPFVYAPHIVNDPTECNRVVPYSELSTDLSSGTAPPFLWVTPNVMDDMHTGTVNQGDTWLSQQLPTVMSSSWYQQGGTIIITFDEGVTNAGCCAGAAGGHIATIVVSNSVAPGARLSTDVDHAGVLRTIEDLYGLSPLGAAANPTSGTLLGLLGESTSTPSATAVSLVPTRDGGGYWLASSTGRVTAHGDAVNHGSMGGKPLNEPIVGMAATPTGGGYWEVASDGGIFTFGTAGFYGSEGGKPLNEPIVGMAATPTGKGYWEVASDGGIFTFGTAGFYGSEGGKPLNKPIVGMAATPTGKGYWEVASDGGIFTFGTAGFYGSEGGKPLDKPIVGMAATPTGKGYWEVASDGGIFTFGTAGFFGSEGGKPLNKPIVGMAATPTGKGYWEVASDGGIFTFGTAGFYGSEGGKPLNKPIVGMAATPTGKGYWEVASDGGIFTFGTAGFYGA